MSEEQVFTQCTVGGPVRVYVEDGVIKRMRPIVFDEDDAASWTIEARGRTFTPPRKTTLQSYEVPERTRVYTNRIQYPLKRKNFDPGGERHPELRGKDEYVRISWEEALDLVAREITRVRETYGPAAITAMTPSHQNWGFLHYKLGPLGPVLQHPRLQPVPGQSRQLGGLALGRHSRLGLLVAPRPLRAVGAPAGRAQAHRAGHLLVGGPQQHLVHVQRPGEPHLAPLDEGARHPVRGHRPARQLHGEHHGRQVDRAAPGHRRGAGPGDRLRLAHRGHLRPLLRREPHLRVRRVEGVHPGRGRGRHAQDAASGRRRSATSRRTPSSRWRASGRPRRPCSPWPASSGPPAPAARPTPRSGPGCAST